MGKYQILKKILGPKPKVDLDVIEFMTVVIIFVNGNSVTHRHMTGVDYCENMNVYRVWNNDETYCYDRRFVFAIQTLKEEL